MIKTLIHLLSALCPISFAAAIPEKVEEMKALLEKLASEGRSTPGAR